jgi:hypothetical protein
MSDRRVYIAQLLCPHRHCIVAVAEEFGTLEEAEDLRKLLAPIFEQILGHRDRCALCGSSDFHIEIHRTLFRTMEEARPALFEQEARQYLTQRFLKSHRN